MFTKVAISLLTGVVASVLLLAARAESAGVAPGCGCDLTTYQRELELVNGALRATMKDGNEASVATGWAWGINPCQTGPLSNTERYAFDLTGEDSNKCHDHCVAEPWQYGKAAWDLCIRGGQSFCTAKTGGAPGESRGHNCIAHGTNLEGCRADPACEVTGFASTEERCRSVPGRVFGNGVCRSDTCGALKTCTTHWMLKCKVNCNDCQALTMGALRDLNLKCFTVDKLESYYLRGNYGRKNGFGHLTAGTHSMVKLVPKPGSFAELVSPLGLVGDALEHVQLRRITATQTVSDGLSVDREAVVLTPKDKDDLSTPLELMPHALGVAGQDDHELTSGCPVTPLPGANDRAEVVHSVSTSLQAYYGLLQRDYCGGEASAGTDRDRALARIRSQTQRYSESMAGVK